MIKFHCPYCKDPESRIQQVTNADRVLEILGFDEENNTIIFGERWDRNCEEGGIYVCSECHHILEFIEKHNHVDIENSEIDRKILINFFRTKQDRK